MARLQLLMEQDLIIKDINITEYQLLNYIKDILNTKDINIYAQLDLENYIYAIKHNKGNKIVEKYYYNDYDDYEDEIEFASDNWIKSIF